MNWINWTNKSENITFKSSIKGVGDGEEKIASELNTFILGQNSNYDMKVLINDIEVECDVKKLDNYTFNTGVKGRNALRPIKHEILDLLNIFKKIIDSSVLTIDEKNKIVELNEISPDEICVSNIQKINDVCFMLHNKQKFLRSSLPNVNPFEKNGEPLEMSLEKYYNICIILEQTFPYIFDSYKDTLEFLSIITHKYISNPKLFKDSLDNLVSIFKEIQLIFVDEKKGYCIWNNIECIKFERITRGHPRFRVCI
jgi:hypothetical protein